MTYFTAARVASDLPAWRPSLWLAVSLAAAFEIVLTGASLSRASIEIYHLRRPEAYFESLPVTASTHLNAALASRIARTIGAGIVILAARSLSAKSDLTNFWSLLPLALFILITALAEVFAGINWIHWSHIKDRRAAAFAVILLLSTSVVAGLLLALAFKPEELIAWRALWFAGAVGWAAILYLITHRSHNRWRASDIEYVKRLQTPGRRSIFHSGLIRRRFDAKVAAQLARDLQLTVRAFSSAVYVVAGMVGLWLAVLITALKFDLLPIAERVIPLAPDDASGFDATWLPEVMAVKFACALVTASIAALMPVLIAYELPLMWLERAIGTTGLEIWQAKLWYTRIVSAPAPIVVWLAGMASGEVPLFYLLPLLAECLFGWWMVSSIIGALSYEVPTRPGLAIVVVVTLGLAMGLFTALLWPFGLILYVQAMHGLTQRGRARARYYLITEGD